MIYIILLYLYEKVEYNNLGSVKETIELASFKSYYDALEAFKTLLGDKGIDNDSINDICEEILDELGECEHSYIIDEGIPDRLSCYAFRKELVH